MSDYQSWPADKLISRIIELESKLKNSTEHPDSANTPNNQLKELDPPNEKESIPKSDTRATDSKKHSTDAIRFQADVARVAAYSPNLSLRQIEHMVKRSKKRIDKGRDFDIDSFPKRKIAFKISYDGARYFGFATQGISKTDEIEKFYPTVEGEIFKALIKGKLITSEETCGYSRCGRTDRGVSAFGQVISLYVRSSAIWHEPDSSLGDSADIPELYIDTFNASKPIILPDNELELPYARIINNLLPMDIRVLAWTPVNSDFNARFSCRSRQYRYFFPKMNMDIKLMQESARKYIGTHDFRNFCKLDLSKNIQSFERTILESEIEPINIGSQYYPTDISESLQFTNPKLDSGLLINTHGLTEWYQFRVKGTAFLWHQVRCLVSFLFLIGQKLETPDIIDKMLDITIVDGKPEYQMGSDSPLILDSCEFPDSNLNWIYYESETNLSRLYGLTSELTSQWIDNYIKAGFSFILLNKLLDLPTTIIDAQDGTHYIQARSKNSGKKLKESKLVESDKHPKSSTDICTSSEPKIGADQNTTPSKPLITLPWSDCINRNLYNSNKNTKIYYGGSEFASSKKYVSIINRNRSENFETKTERYLKRKRKI
ncbi:hypothetical protein BB561_002067 [Smittium simulii]|uniref:Pseudouridine synthase I TruA alpha/beta domain-containing protein n=1 Tax=Smittium simulii TaxID=133385 RepID=A0A2T9YRX3_9FUNG|nr:hypothetical protein BB561_002067 [Smittium simulii]